MALHFLTVADNVHPVYELNIDVSLVHEANRPRCISWMMTCVAFRPLCVLRKSGLLQAAREDLGNEGRGGLCF